MQRGLAFLAAAFWLALGATATAQTSQSPTSPAQSWPTRTVRIVIPLAAGGGGDVFARLLADELQRKYGQPFVVENRPGGGLNIGARACAEAPPDGYTLCVMSSEPVVYNQFLFRSLPFNPEKDFEPITNLFFNLEALVVNAQLKVKTIPDLVALAKAKPGTLELRHVLVRAGAVHGEAQEDARHRHRARALPQRQRGRQRHHVRHDAGRPARAEQHAVADPIGSHHRHRAQRQCALAAVP